MDTYRNVCFTPTRFVSIPPTSQLTNKRGSMANKCSYQGNNSVKGHQEGKGDSRLCKEQLSVVMEATSWVDGPCSANTRMFTSSGLH